MLALIATVFVASLTGSLHCAGMCGPFVAFAVGAGETRRTQVTIGGRPTSRLPRARLHVAYHGGRLVTYTILGAVSGALGAALDLGGNTLGIANAAAIMAGATMALFGVIAILRIRGISLPHPPVPGVLRRAFERGHTLATSRGPAARALIIGLLTTLLPCGWLYAFAVVAAGTAHPALGALTMAVFWAGTLPVLVGLGIGIQKLAGMLGRHVPTMTALTLVIIGLLTVWQRAAIPSFVAITAGAAPVQPASVDEAAAHAATLDAQDAACCHANDAPAH